MQKSAKLIDQLDNSVIAINDSSFSIGRSLDCNHVIKSLGVSRFHCVIKRNNGHWLLCDRSSNGTYVNDKLYTFNKSTALRDGDKITLGSSNMSFIFRTEEAPPDSATTSKKADQVFPDDQEDLEKAACIVAKTIEEAGKCEEFAKREEKAGEKVIDSDIVEDELTCSICSELFVKAMTLNCSHTFCKHCIDKWKATKSRCPICRKHISNMSSTLVLDNFIEKIISTQSDEAKEERRQLVKHREEAAAGGSSQKNTEVVDLDEYYDEDSDVTYSSDDVDYEDYRPGRRRRHYYGGYGNCFVCHQPGHWANSCPHN